MARPSHKAENKKAAPTGKVKASPKRKSASQHMALSSRATDTASQCIRALELLKTADQDTYSLRRRGISHPAQRIKDLIDQGHAIYVHRVTAVDSDGYAHRGVALYSINKDVQ